MATYKHRISKPRAPLALGGRTLRLLIGKSQRPFSVHQIRLCDTSSYFKNKLETGRKSPDGNCGICLDPLKTHDKILTWCKTCGNNVHQECLEKWAKRDFTCPMCRAPWVPREVFETMTFRDLDSTGFEVYVQWLYTQTIPEYEEDNEARCKRLIRAHVVGEAVEDPSFVNAVRCKMVHDSVTVNVSRTAIEYAYRYNSGTSRALRSFLLHLYSMQLPGNLEWLKIAPRRFLVDLAEDLIGRNKCKEMKAGEDIWTRLTQAGLLEKGTTEDDA